MRPTLSVLLVVAVTASPTDARESSPQQSAQRTRVIAALEHLMQTGEPHDTEHGEGAWLQAAVDIAFTAKDHEIIRLAQRAAAPLVAHVTTPVSATRDLPGFELRHRMVLRLQTPMQVTADIFVSLDGGDFVHVGAAPPAGTSRSLSLPPAALAPGAHHVRLQARIVYKGNGEVPPPETRTFSELTYAVYDPERRTPADARIFIEAPLSASARQLDARLPDEPFGSWLQRVLAAHSPNAKVDWLARYCDDRLRESGAPTKARQLCSVAYFGTGGLRGHIWIRTGPIELTDTAVKWLVEMPAFEALTLEYNSRAEFDTLADLPQLLSADPSQLPMGDVTVAPEDIHVTAVDTPAGPQLQISVVVRNEGFVDLRGVQVFIAATVNGPDGSKATVVVDVPRRGHAEITHVLPFSAPYGTVLVHAMQMSAHAPAESFQPDPTPENAIAFRIANPKQAPAGYATKIIKDCGGVCRGY